MNEYGFSNAKFNTYVSNITQQNKKGYMLQLQCHLV